MTEDVDLVVLVDDDPAKFLSAAPTYNIEPRIPDVLAFAERSRVLLLRHTPTGIDTDISMGAIGFERQMIDQALPVTVEGVDILVPRPEDLVIMKALARRPIDQFDIKGILERNPSLDLKYVHDAVAGFSGDLEMPEILEDFEKLLPPDLRGESGLRE
jgi:hypothetical protein